MARTKVPPVTGGADPPSQSHDPRFPMALKPSDAARMLGVSERFLWTLTQSGTMPCVRLGSGKRRVVRYPVASLAEWLKANTTIAHEAGKEVQA